MVDDLAQTFVHFFAGTRCQPACLPACERARIPMKYFNAQLRNMPCESRSAHLCMACPLQVMARQYLGCPASSATVERLFSIVGNAFSKKRQSSEADTLADIVFAKVNVD